MSGRKVAGKVEKIQQQISLFNTGNEYANPETSLVPPPLYRRSTSHSKLVLAYWSALAPRTHTSPISSSRIAWYVADRLEIKEVYDANNPCRDVPAVIDELWVIVSSSRFIRSPWLESSRALMRPARAVIFCVNDFRGRLDSVYEGRIAPDARYVTLTIVEKMISNPDSDHRRNGVLVNWNILTYDPRVTLEDIEKKYDRRERRILYHGAWRTDRTYAFDKYLGALDDSLVLSVSKVGDRKPFAAAAPRARLIGRLSYVIDNLARYSATIILEDNFHYKNPGGLPPNRFYEALSAGTAMLFDCRSIATFDRFGYDIRPYAVNSASDVHAYLRSVNDLRDIALAQSREWRRDYRTQLDEEFNLAVRAIRTGAIGRIGPPLHVRRYDDEED